MANNLTKQALTPNLCPPVGAFSHTALRRPSAPTEGQFLFSKLTKKPCKCGKTRERNKNTCWSCERGIDPLWYKPLSFNYKYRENEIPTNTLCPIHRVILTNDNFCFDCGGMPND